MVLLERFEDMTTPVMRWDIYDIADELADLPGLLHQVRSSDELAEVCDVVNDLVNRLWEAALVGGSVGPFYQEAP